MKRSKTISISMKRSKTLTNENSMSVPPFGGWENEEGQPDYSVTFSILRNVRKQNKSGNSRVSIGNEQELLTHRDAALAASTCHVAATPSAIHHLQRRHIPSVKKKLKSYFVCFIGA